MKKTASRVLIIPVFICICACSSNDTARNAEPVKGAAHSSMIGKILPDMALESFQNGKIGTIRLSQYRGKWLVLFFYPADFTFVCPTELKELSEYYGEFKNLGAEIISVSTDSVFVHRAWQKSNDSLKKVQYPMASDRSGRFCRSMGTYIEEKGLSERATFLVDPDGRIVSYEFHHEAIGRSSDELLRKLNAAIAVRQGGGGYCPAGWKEGEGLIHGK